MAAGATLGRAIELRSRLVKFLLQLVIVCFSPQVVFGQLTVTSLPATLFQDNGGVHNVVNGSVIQLFCSVESLNVTFSWTKDGSPVVINVPNLRERTCNDSTTTTSMLTIEDFQSNDNGTYQCMATNGQESGSGSSTTLSALASGDTVLTFNTEPSDNEQIYEGSFFFRRDYRTGIPSGTAVDDTLLMCDARRVGTSTSPDPTVQWIRNGKLINNSTGLMTSLTIDSFSQSDVGEYQCIYTDSDSDAEVLTSIPYRLQTDIYTFDMVSGRDDSTVFLERISPEVIFLRPPEELVIKVKSTGRVLVVQWVVNAVRIPDSVLEGFANHREIYFRKETTSSDIGLYEVSVLPDPITGQLIYPFGLEFIVTSPVDANTTTISEPFVTVIEGNTVTISCVSTGAPTPSIKWELNGEVAPFIPSNVVDEIRAVLFRDSNGDFQPDITLGSITSNLMIVNAQYPDHDGIYTCIGTNDDQMRNSSTASIAVQVQVPPEVKVTASSQCVSIGATVTLSCNVNRTNPAVDTYVWVNEAHSTTIVGTESNITVTFTLTQDFGTYRCTVNNTAGLSGSDSVTIGQGSIISAYADIMMDLPENVTSRPLGTHQPDSQGDCLPCPRNTNTNTSTHTTVCPCLSGYFRTNFEGPEIDCTRPPSTCRNIVAISVEEQIVKISWSKPDNTGRDDFYYIVEYSDGESVGSVPVVSEERVVQYSIGGLRPATDYTITVTVENGVSDQDQRNEYLRRCELKLTTQEGKPSPPNDFQSLCDVIVWVMPSNPNGDITTYEAQFYIPGTENSRLVEIAQDRTFYIIKEQDKLGGDTSTFIRVRAKSRAGAGKWSDGKSLGCDLVATTPPVCPPCESLPTTASATIESTSTESAGTSAPISSVYFSLGGQVYGNNSVLSLSDIREGASALLCKTNLSNCCKSVPYRFGQFYYPNGEKVPIRSGDSGFYRDRGDQQIRLNRRDGIISPVGKFRCEIPDADGVSQNLFITLD